MIKIICKNCNEEFKTYKSSNRKYCSVKCANDLIGKNKRKRIKLICSICNKKYEIIHSRLNKSKTCSRECAQKYAARKQKTNKVKLICLNCNKEYKKCNYLRKTSKYCSIKCKGEYQKESLKGKNNPNFGNYKYTREQYKNWIRYKEAVRNKSYRIYKKYKKIINPLNLEIGRWKYHLDHKYSIHDGFHNKIPVSLVASLNNLQVIKSKENLQKGVKSIIQLQELVTPT